MIEINLIPDVKQELLRAQTQRNVVISGSIILAIGAGVIVVLAALYVFGAQALMMSSANSTIDTEYKKLTSVEDLDKLLTIQNQLKTVSTLNANKRAGSRVYNMLNVIVPTDPHNIKISSVSVEPAGTGDDTGSGDTSSVADGGATITIEGQTAGSYASLEVFEKTIAAAVIEYKLADGVEGTGTLNCGDSSKQCRHLAVGDGGRSKAINVTEMNFGEDQDGTRTLRFKLSFVVVPELLSSTASDVAIKIGENGNVTDSYLGVPRAIFGDRSNNEEDK